jgi:hypothetical protein
VDVVGDGSVRIRLGVINAGDFFILECGKEALGHRVGPAITLAAHARHEPVRGQCLAKLTAGENRGQCGMALTY